MWKKYTDEFLISELKRFAKENNRSPKMKDMCVKNGYPGVSVYQKYFGTWNDALRLAELDINIVSKYSKEFLILELHRFVKEFGRVPKYDEIDYTKGYPSCQAFRDCFGTFNNALVEANLDINITHEYDIKFLIDELKRFVNENGRTPSQSDFCNSNTYPSSSVYIRIFGTWNKALKKVGFSPNRIIHTYDGTEVCSKCGSNKTYRKWNYDEVDNRLCDKCSRILYFEKYPEKLKQYKHKDESKRRGYGFKVINDYFNGSNAHHLHLENTTEFVVYIPYFIHQLHSHNSNIPETMVTPNALALDYWINQEEYDKLFSEEFDGTDFS